VKFFLPFLLILKLFSFQSLYDFKTSDFEYSHTDKLYKLTLKNQKYVEYKREKEGYKFFIPYFTKEFSLKILRFNSTGYLNLVLSMDKRCGNILNVTTNNLNYYISDYKGYGRQISYLLKNYSIPYKKTTSISIEAYNLPASISNRLNRYFYLKKDIEKDNKLEYILYSFYITFDKTRVDNYIKTHHLKDFQDFVKHIYSLSLKKVVKKKIVKKQVVKKKVIKKQNKKLKYSLHLKRFLFMKDYGFINRKIECKMDRKKLIVAQKNIEDNVEKLENLINLMGKKLNSNYLFKGDKIYDSFYETISPIIDKLNLIPLQIDDIKIDTEKCVFDEENIKKVCFEKKDYFQNYLYGLLKKDKLPTEEELLAFGDYRTFNDVGKYYFEIGNFKKAQSFLSKAYVLADDKRIPSHNLGVLYATSFTDLTDYSKGIKYLKQSKMDIDNYNLGVFYYLGKGVKESDKIARNYFSKATAIPYGLDNFKIMQKYKIGLK